MYLICYYFKKGAIVVFAILLLFAVSGLQPAEAFRAKFLNTIKKDNIDATVIRPEDEELLKDWEDYWYPTYIPEGYSLWEAAENDFQKILVFAAGEDTDKIRLFCFKSTSMQITHDTDNHEYKEISVGAYNGYLFSATESEALRVIWTTEKGYVVLESSGSLSEEDMLKMAESLNFIKE